MTGVLLSIKHEISRFIISFNRIVDFSIVRIVFNRIRVSLRIFFLFFFFFREIENAHIALTISIFQVFPTVRGEEGRGGKKNISKLINFLSNVHISENVFRYLNTEFFIIQMHS